MIWKDVPISKYFKSERGQRLIEVDMVSGDIPYISSSKENNGVNSFVLPPDFMKKHKNCLTLANSGSVGYCFYHSYEFVASDHVTVIWPKNNVQLDENLALFLKPIFEAVKPKFNFGREISDKRLGKLSIQLPFKDEKTENPDWDYMKNYIAEIKKTIQFNPIVSKYGSASFSTDNWKMFSLSKDLFSISRGTRLTKANRISGDTPLVTAGYINQGVASYIEPDEMTVYSNCITIDMFGNCFYRDYEFCCDDNILVMKPKFAINAKIALFIVSVVNLDSYKFSFGRQYRKKHIVKHSILLPATKKGSKDVPDFEYMDSFMSKIAFSEFLN